RRPRPGRCHLQQGGTGRERTAGPGGRRVISEEVRSTTLDHSSAGEPTTGKVIGGPGDPGRRSPTVRAPRRAARRPTRRPWSRSVPRWVAAARQWRPETVLLETPVTPHPKRKRGTAVSSNGNGSDSQSPLNVTDASHAGHSGSGAVGTRPFAAHVVGHSQAVLSCASAAMSRVEREIDH